MSKIVRARYENGVLKLLEPVDLKEGEEVIVRLETYEDRIKNYENIEGFSVKLQKKRSGNFY